MRPRCVLVLAGGAFGTGFANVVHALGADVARTALLLSPLALRPDPFVARGTFHELVYAIACCVLRPDTDNRLAAGAVEVGGIPQRTLAVVASSSLWTRVTCPVAPVRVNSDFSASRGRSVGVIGACCAGLRPRRVLVLAGIAIGTDDTWRAGALRTFWSPLATLRRCLKSI